MDSDIIGYVLAGLFLVAFGYFIYTRVLKSKGSSGTSSGGSGSGSSASSCPGCLCRPGNRMHHRGGKNRGFSPTISY